MILYICCVTPVLCSKCCFIMESILWNTDTTIGLKMLVFFPSRLTDELNELYIFIICWNWNYFSDGIVFLISQRTKFDVLIF